MKFNLLDLLLFIALASNVVISAVFPNLYSSFASTVLYILVLSRVFKVSPTGFLFFSPVIFVHFAGLVSLNAIESGAYMKEMGRSGFPSAAGASFAFVISVFIGMATKVFVAGAKPSSRKILKLNIESHAFIGTWAAPLTVILFIAWLLFKGTLTGFPLLDGFDRFDYRRLYGDPLTLNILNLKIVIASFLGVSAASCATAIGKSRHHFVFAAYILISFLFGDKFFIIISASLYYVAIQLAFRPEVLTQQAKRFFLPAAGALLVGVSMTVYIYSGLGTYSAAKTLALLFERFASQGQLWFISLNENFRWIGFDAVAVRENVMSLIANPHQDYVFEKRLSAFHFVEQYAPGKMFLSFVKNQGYVAPAGVFEAYMLELLGFLGTLAMVALAGCMLGKIAGFLRSAVSTGNPFAILLPAYMIVQFYYLIVSGTPYNLLGLSAFKAYAAFSLLYLGVAFWVKRAEQRPPSEVTATPGH